MSLKIALADDLEAFVLEQDSAPGDYVNSLIRQKKTEHEIIDGLKEGLRDIAEGRIVQTSAREILDQLLAQKRDRG